MSSEEATVQKKDPDYGHDDEYYMDTFTLLVEGTLFKVPKRRFIQESEVFRDMLSLPQAVSDSVEGVEGICDSKPITLEGINKNDFKAFLQVLYPSKSFLGADSYSKDQCLSFLKLSTTWFFNDSRRIAIENLSNKTMTPSEKVVNGRAHKVSSWLIEGFYELVQARESISDVDAREIGFETAFHLTRIREDVANKRGSNSSPMGTRYWHKRSSLETAGIENIFKAELEEIKEHEATYGYIQPRKVPVCLTMSSSFEALALY